MKKKYKLKAITLVFFVMAISLFVMFRSDVFREKKYPESSPEKYSQNTSYSHPVDSPPPAGNSYMYSSKVGVVIPSESLRDTLDTTTYKFSPQLIRLMSSKSMVILPDIQLDSLIKTTVSE